MKELHFIHIPKCAGTSIINNANKHNILWAHNDPILKEYIKHKYFWHYPMKNISNKDDYNHLINSYDFFTVVRNPYSRALSAYQQNIYPRENIYTMNDFIYNAVKEHTIDHFYPQFWYVYDNNEKQIVNNVLHYETLDDDFQKCMDKYNLPVKLENKYNVFNKRFTIYDLSPETINIINQVYHKDFEYFGYSKI